MDTDLTFILIERGVSFNVGLRSMKRQIDEGVYLPCRFQLCVVHLRINGENQFLVEAVPFCTCMHKMHRSKMTMQCLSKMRKTSACERCQVDSTGG